MQLQLTHIFILLLCVKFLTSYTDFKFIITITVLCLILYYSYVNKHVSFDIKLLENISKDKLFEDKKQHIHQFIDQSLIFSFNSELKIDIKNKVNIFTDNISTIYYNDVKNCHYYVDVLVYQKYEILNSARSFIITSTLLENYQSLENEMLQFETMMNDILENVIIKCPSYNKNIFMQANNYHHKHSFDQY
jgi:hypothetical protein